MKPAGEVWLLDDGRIMGGGQGTTLRLGRFVDGARIVAPGDSALAARAREEGIRVEPVDFPTVPSPRSLRQLRRLLRSVGEDALVVGASLRAQVYAHTAALGLRRAPRIVHFMSEQDSARRAVARLLLRRFGAVVALGGNAAEAYRRALGTRVVEANNILGPEEIAAAVSGRRPRPGGGPPVLGVLARLVPEKGILELVEELASSRGSWSKLLVGAARQDEGHARRVEWRIVKLGLQDDVSLLGHVADIGAFLAGVDALVVPSVGNEGQPTSLLEALAHGRPVVVRDSVWAPDYEGLPVARYRDTGELERVLGDLPPGQVDAAELERRFGPGQLLDALSRSRVTG